MFSKCLNILVESRQIVSHLPTKSFSFLNKKENIVLDTLPKKVRKDDIFPDVETMLIFILSYMKNNPLQQTHAAAFNMTQPQSNLWIHLLKKILNSALEKANCLPCRDVDTLNKLLKEGQNILIDATERPIPRP